jgi:hypothetical protein
VIVVLCEVRNVSAISWQEQVTFWQEDDDDVCFVLAQHAELDFYSAISFKQPSCHSSLCFKYIITIKFIGG